MAVTLSFQPPAPITASIPGSWTPIQIVDIELTRPLQSLAALPSPTGPRYSAALAVVRCHTYPIGVVQLDLRTGDIGPQELAATIWATLGDDLQTFLRANGMPKVDNLGITGLAILPPPCLQERAALIQDGPLVSIVVATRDRPDSLATCLNSLLATAYARFEVLVIDNAPRTAATADLVRTIAAVDARVRYIREDRAGLSWARNRGLHEARGEIVAYTDDDVTVTPFWLASLVHGFAQGSNVACVTGLTLPAELETPAQIWFEQFGGFGKGFIRRVFDRSYSHGNEGLLYPYASGQFGSGNNMAFTRAFLDVIGGFDPALGAGSPSQGGEDLAAYFEVIDRGYQLVYEPGATIFHTHRRDLVGLRSQIYGYGTGLTAYLTKCLWDNPVRAFAIAARIPKGLAFASSPRSAKNHAKQGDYPAELSRIERIGMLRGSMLYLRGRYQTHGGRARMESAGAGAGDIVPATFAGTQSSVALATDSERSV